MEHSDVMQSILSNSWRRSVPGLSRITQLLERMGNPHKKLKFVHIAGTNGKGSVSAMLESVLREAGYKTGLFTSPFIHHFGERMQVEGIPISHEQVEELASWMTGLAQDMEDPPTEFEVITAMAMAYFQRSGCDIVVLEVGMGGRLDATNVIDRPEAAVITTIGLDHTTELGDTLEKIAGEKAGIIKAGCPVVLYPQQAEVEAVFQAVCRERSAALHKVSATEILPANFDLNGQTFDYGSQHGLKISLLGQHQLKNAATVAETVSVLAAGGWKIPETALYGGLEKARWPGRFDVLRRSPVVVVDGGHNPQGAQTVAENCRLYFPGKKLLFVVGVLADKDSYGIFSPIFPLADKIFTVSPNIPRALPADQLRDRLSQYHPHVTACGSIREGLEAALREAQEDDVICALGSLYMVGDIRRYFNLA
ncbi:folylpolyglutamate synthase/dihydrofolate synthase family protein [Oscillospiraceae bacterium MB08-C2-2]|nr:folylpolyglutamate synthase/dihydrofolate synthase family protein [Oscillospiraceae bacterium MB08-C2-2]